MLNQHLTEEIIANFAEQLLPQDEAAKVQNHLQSCAKCTAEVNNFAKIVNLMKTDEAKDAPADLLVWTKNIFRSKIAEPKKSILQKIFAVLEMDLSPNTAAFGERSASSPTRQLFYKADEIGISLRISKDENELNLMGQILGDGFDNCEIELQNNQTSISVGSNEMSEFRMSKIPFGNYDLFIRNVETELVIENVNLD
jgi:hypothetical protein